MIQKGFDHFGVNAKLAQVKSHKLEMLAGRWRQAGQDNFVITTDDDGEPLLINGQHRLRALVEAAEVMGKDFALSFTFAFGVDVDTYRVMDTGSARGADAALANEGCQYPKIAAAAIKCALRYLEGGVPDGRGAKISPEKVHETYLDWQDQVEMALDAGMRFGNRRSDPLLLNQSTAVAIHLLIHLISDYGKCYVARDAGIFLERLHTGYGINDGRDPVGKARKELARLAERETKGQRAAIVVKAWNAMQGGPKNGIASWRATDPREPFPQIL